MFVVFLICWKKSTTIMTIRFPTNPITQTRENTTWNNILSFLLWNASYQQNIAQAHRNYPRNHPIQMQFWAGIIVARTEKLTINEEGK